jgi:hypothetical protein
LRPDELTAPRGARTMNPMPAKRLLPSVLISLVLFATGPGATNASHHGNPGIGSFLDCNRPLVPPRCTSVANNSVHYVYIHPSVPGRLAWAIRRTMREDYGPTNLALREESRITRRTDVIVTADDYGQNGAAGWVWCPPKAPQGVNQHGDRWCRRQQLHFNLNPRYAVFFADRASRDYMACHELGHTIGLHHWGNPPISPGPERPTCMQPDVPNGPTNLHRWDVEDINLYYPRPRAAAVSGVLSPAPAMLRRAGCSGSGGTDWLGHIGP